MRIVTLSNDFYKDYGSCPEIMKKTNRPYCCLEITIGDRNYAIPVRHNIKHSYAFHTIGNAGIDYTKAVVICKSDYISPAAARIDSAEWNILKKNENKIIAEFKKYLRLYEKAKLNSQVPRYAQILSYTTLKYFEK